MAKCVGTMQSKRQQHTLVLWFNQSYGHKEFSRCNLIRDLQEFEKHDTD